MSEKYVYLEASITINLPEDTPPKPDAYDLVAFDNWYNKYIEPHVRALYQVPGIELDIHDEGYETGD